MKQHKIILTTGFRYSKFCLILSEKLRREGLIIDGILEVSPFQLDRIKKLTDKSERRKLKEKLKNLINPEVSKSNDSPLNEYMKEADIPMISLKKWSDIHNVDYQVVNNLNSKKTEKYLSNKNIDLLIYGGGGLFRKNIIQILNGKILNAHLGPLPEIRGMNAIEWSVLLGLRNEITIHFINEGIDTGKVIERLPVIISKMDSIQSIREKAMLQGINGLLNFLKNESEINRIPNDEIDEHYRQCFELSDIMKEFLEHKINQLN